MSGKLWDKAVAFRVQLWLVKTRRRGLSSGVVVNHTEQLGFTKAVIVRDPDGHAVEVVEKFIGQTLASAESESALN